MLEFKVIEKLKTNKDLTGILKDFKYKVKLGQIKTIVIIYYSQTVDKVVRFWK